MNIVAIEIGIRSLHRRSHKTEGHGILERSVIAHTKLNQHGGPLKQYICIYSTNIATKENAV